ncbi:MAG: hypothetical protein ACK56I_28665, partial [bacterium]
MSGRECPVASSSSFVTRKRHSSHYRIFDQVHLVLEDDVCSCGSVGDFRYFVLDDTVRYIGFADDFGPMNLGSIYQFCCILDSELSEASANEAIALITEPDLRFITNAVFLLG